MEFGLVFEVKTHISINECMGLKGDNCHITRKIKNAYFNALLLNNKMHFNYNKNAF
jgi:hypothetical protein